MLPRNIIFLLLCHQQICPLFNYLSRVVLTIGLQLLFVPVAEAQEKIVRGTVLDENRKGMPGVSVVEKGINNGTATDINGEFSIRVHNDRATLVFTFVGYTSREMFTENMSVVHVTMEPHVEVLSELVVVGYGVQQKKDVTGSIAVADGEELSVLPTSNLENNFQGRLAGVNVISSGEPGSTPLVIIRGASTFAGSSQPLYVVDGVPTMDISTINPLDVESATALKDAGAASIYGSRAANGVILITTKRGKEGTMKLFYNGYYGIQSPGEGLTNLLDTQGYSALTWLAYQNSGQTPPSDMYGDGLIPIVPDYYKPEGKFEGEVDESTYDEIINPITRTNKRGTDWYDEITEVAPIQNHDIAASGGSDNSKYYFGLNYFNQNGIIIYTNAERYSMRINTEFTIKDKVRIGENLTNVYRSNSRMLEAGDGSSNAIMECYVAPVILPVYDIQGNFASYNNWVPNPYAGQSLVKDSESYSVRTFGNVYMEVDFLRNFMFRTSFGGSMQYGHSYTFFPAYNRVPNSFSEQTYDEADWNWQNTLTFKKAFRQHSLSLLIGAEAIKTDIGRAIGGSRTGYYSDDPDFWTLNSGNVDSQTNFGYSNTPAALLGYFGRVDYNYHDRFLLSVTVRRDGSSKFIQHKYGTFPALTLAWRISEESFLQSASFISDLKLRAGYGIMGDQINASPNNSYTIYISDPGASYYDIKGNNSVAELGFGKSFTGNPNGQWQQNETTNLGLDFSFFSNQWSGSIDVYKKVTDKLLYTAEAPGTSGTSSPAARNVGKMENKGIDVVLNYKTGVGRDWKVNVGLTLTSYVNKVLKVANNVPYFEPVPFMPFIRIQSGQSISAFYGYQVDGLWQSQEEIDVANSLGGIDLNRDGMDTTFFQQDALPGRFRYRDVNGDSVITSADRTFIGNPNPKFTYGLNLSLTYKSFDFTLFFYGVQGNDIYNYMKRNTDFFWSGQGGKSEDLLYRSWTPERRNTTIPMAEPSENFSNNQHSSYYIEDGSYLRIKNIQIGYNLPKAVLSKASIGLARIYLQAVNPFTFTKYSGLDPEIGGSTVAFGYGTIYPATQQFIIGLNLEF